MSTSQTLAGHADDVDQAIIRYETTSRGAELCIYFWPAATPPVKGIIQVLHGHGSHMPHEVLKHKAAGQRGSYEGSWAQAMNAAGYLVVGADHEGAGRSSGLRCYCDSFDNYIEDGLLVTRRCTEMGIPGFEASLPKFLLGHSMGGCLAVMMALREGSSYAGVALMAPMLSLEKVSNQGLNYVLKPLLGIANWLVPTLAIGEDPKNSMYPDIQKVFDADPLNYTGPVRVRNASEYMRVTSWLMANLEQVHFPFILFHSENDTMCDCDGSKALYARAKTTDKTLHLVNEHWHGLQKEPGNEEIIKTILHWYNQHGVN